MGFPLTQAQQTRISLRSQAMSSTFTDTPDLPLPSSYGDPERTGLGANDLFEGISEHLFFTLGRRVDNASPHDFYLGYPSSASASSPGWSAGPPSFLVPFPWPFPSV